MNDPEELLIFTCKCVLDDGWHSGDIAVFYLRYAYDKQFGDLIQFSDKHGLRFEVLCKDGASTFSAGCSWVGLRTTKSCWKLGGFLILRPVIF